MTVSAQEFINSCALGEEYKVEDLLKLEYIESPNITDPQGNTPLHISVASKQTGVVATLLKYGADPNIVNKKGQNPLHVAASLGLLDAATILVEYNVEINKKDNNGYAPLHLACESTCEGADKVAIFLISKGAFLDSVTNSNKTAAMLAAKTGKTEVYDLLVKEGADLSIKDSMGLTAEDYKQK